MALEKGSSGFKVDRAAFAAVFGRVAGVASSRGGKEILRNVHLRLEGGQVTLQASDGEIGVRSSIAIDDQAGASVSTMLPTTYLRSVLAESESEILKMEINPGENVVVTCGYSEWRLLVEDPADFPPVPEFRATGWFSFPGAVLKKLIRRTLFATDSESTRYALGGVQVELLAGVATFCATDSRRLAVATGAVTVGGDGDPYTNNPPSVVPNRAMKVIDQLCDGTGTVDIAMEPNSVVVRAGSSMVHAQLVQGRFPDWRKVVPKQFEAEVVIPQAPFLQTVRRAMIIRDAESVAVRFGLQKGFLRLTGQAAEIGASAIELPVEYNGERLLIGFDPRYFAEALKALDVGTSVTFSLISKDDPALLSADNGEFRYVVMPIEVK